MSAIWLFINMDMWPSDAIWRHGSGSALPHIMACCQMAPSYIRTNVDLSSMEFWGIQLGVGGWCWQEVIKLPFCKRTLKITLLNYCHISKAQSVWGLGSFSKVVVTFNHAGGSFNFWSTTTDVWIILSFVIGDDVLHVEQVSCVITNCDQHQWVNHSPLSNSSLCLAGGTHH